MASILQFPYLKALRPHQWTKNLVVFASPLFSLALAPTAILGSVLAFALFCCASSSFYLINDIVDVEADRQHPVKCKRPIASGQVSVPVATSMAIVLLAGALIIGWLQNPMLGAVLLAYALLQVAYNVRLKRTVLLDVIAIATGFVLRASAGGAATGITLSSWFLLCTAMLSLFLGVEKRKAELQAFQLRGGKGRAVLYRYSMALLGRMENTVISGTVLTYALWSSGPRVGGASTPWMMLTLPFVVYGVFRYQFLSDPEEVERRSKNRAEGAQTERPEDVLLHDFPILATVISWILMTFGILWLKSRGVIT